MLDFDNIEDFVKERLGGELLTAPEGEWDKLSTQLNKRKANKVWRLLFFDLGISLVLLSGFMLNHFQGGDKIGHSNKLISTYSTNKEATQLIAANEVINQAKQDNNSNLMDSKTPVKRGEGEGVIYAKEDLDDTFKKDVASKMTVVNLQLLETVKTKKEIIKKKATSLSFKSLASNDNLDKLNSTLKTEEVEKYNVINSMLPIGDFTMSSLILLPVKSVSSEVDKSLMSDQSLNKIGFKQLNKRMSVELSGGMMFHGLAISSQSGSAIKNQIKETHSENFGTNFNLNLNYSITPGFEVYSGLQLEHLTSKFSSSTAENYTEMVDTTFTYWDSNQQAWFTYTGLYEVDKSKLVPFSSTNKYTVISIPFGVNYYQPIGERYYLSGTLGGAITFAGKNSGYSHIINDSEPVDVSTIFRKQGRASAYCGAKIGYKLTTRQSFFLMPWVSLDVNPSTLITNDYTARFIKCGVRAGYRFNL